MVIDWDGARGRCAVNPPMGWRSGEEAGWGLLSSIFGIVPAVHIYGRSNDPDRGARAQASRAHVRRCQAWCAAM